MPAASALRAEKVIAERNKQRCLMLNIARRTARTLGNGAQLYHDNNNNTTLLARGGRDERVAPCHRSLAHAPRKVLLTHARSPCRSRRGCGVGRFQPRALLEALGEGRASQRADAEHAHARSLAHLAQCRLARGLSKARLERVSVDLPEFC